MVDFVWDDVPVGVGEPEVGAVVRRTPPATAMSIDSASANAAVGIAAPKATETTRRNCAIVYLLPLFYSFSAVSPLFSFDFDYCASPSLRAQNLRPTVTTTG